ncbi:MAG: NifU family protein [Pirellulales bacterium]|nr:NifU family protein [Pirellulales bacterium]
MSQADTQQIAITGHPISNAACKFAVEQPVYENASYYFGNAQVAKGSPLAERLFAIDGVVNLLISHNEITVTKSSAVEWPVIGKEIGTAIREHIASGDVAVSSDLEGSLPPVDDLRERVEAVLKTEINPAVASHGGVVDLINVEGNRVFLRMGGGCQGCGQAAATLKFGVEQAIRAAVPEVGDIIDATDHAAGANPYYAN